MLPSATPSSSICFNSACASRATNSERKACGKLTWHGCGPLDGAKKPWQIPLASVGTCVCSTASSEVTSVILGFGMIECYSTASLLYPCALQLDLLLKCAHASQNQKPGLHGVFCTRGSSDTQRGDTCCRSGSPLWRCPLLSQKGLRTEYPLSCSHTHALSLPSRGRFCRWKTRHMSQLACLVSRPRP